MINFITIINIDTPTWPLPQIQMFQMSDIYKLFSYFYRNSDTENNFCLFKTDAVDLRRLLFEKVVCLITERKGAKFSYKSKLIYQNHGITSYHPLA
jgi:hypothetical protein